MSQGIAQLVARSSTLVTCAVYLWAGAAMAWADAGADRWERSAYQEKEGSAGQSRPGRHHDNDRDDDDDDRDDDRKGGHTGPGGGKLCPQLTLVSLNETSRRAIGQGFTEYTYTVTFANQGGTLVREEARVNARHPLIKVRDGKAKLGDIPANGQATSLDTIKLRVHRRINLNPDRHLKWRFRCKPGQVENTPPVADAGEDIAIAVGSPVQLDGSGSSDADGDALGYAWRLQVPAGSAATLTGNTTATPAFMPDVVGEYVALLIVNDGAADSNEDSAIITALPAGTNAPVIGSVPVTVATRDETYVYDVEATDADTGDVLTYSLAEAPAGMEIDAFSGAINWVPTTTQPVGVIVAVTDVSGLQDVQDCVIFVRTGANDQPPALAAINDQSLTLGGTLLLTTAGSDPEGQALVYSLDTAPAGMAINSVTGLLQWTPDTAQVGVHAVTAAVQDASGQRATSAFSVDVRAEANQPPVLAPVGDRVVAAQTAIEIQLTASDGDTGDVLTFGLSGQPASLQFDAVSGTLRWVPDVGDVGAYSLTASVRDSAGASASRSFSIEVRPAAVPPIAESDAYAVGRTSVLSVLAPGVLANDRDGNGDPLDAVQVSDVSIGDLGSGLGSDGSFVYTPPQAPPITVGIAQQCSTPVSGNFFITQGTPAIADVDGDGVIESVGFTPTGIGQRLIVWRLDTCAVESDVLIPPGTGTYGRPSSASHIGLVNIDGDVDLEIVVGARETPAFATDGTHLLAFDHDGTFLWRSEDITLLASGMLDLGGPAFADLDGDGSVEIIVATPPRNGGGPMVVAVFDRTGALLWENAGHLTAGIGLNPTAVHIADLNLDGRLEIVAGASVFSAAGQLLFTLPANSTQNPAAAIPLSGIGVANMDTDPFAEIVVVNPHGFFVFDHNGGLQTFSALGGFGPISIADYDGDGQPEVANVNRQLFIFEADGTRRLQGGTPTTHDFFFDQGTYALANFDFDGDGTPEIIQLGRNFREAPDNRRLYIWQVQGNTLVELAKHFDPQLFNAGTNLQIFPAVADVDDDGAAEIVVAGNNSSFVFEGLPGNPWPAARKVRNQWHYKATSVREDGTVPAERPYWLLPGLNEENSHVLIPGEDPGASDAFTYRANDGTADSNIAAVGIAITPNTNPPLIVSTPVLGASPGFDYRYGVLATDADLGDALTYVVVDAPPGMTIDDFTGVIDWLPAQTGSARVQVVVSDTQGNTDQQSWQINVVPPVAVPSLGGLADDAAMSTLDGVGLATGNVSQQFSDTVPVGQVISQSLPPGSQSAAGAPVDYVLSLGPRPVFAPDVTGFGEAAAIAQIESLNLEVGSITRVNDAGSRRGEVLVQSPAPGTPASAGDAVDLTISGGPALTVVIEQPMLAAGAQSALLVRAFNSSGQPIGLPGDINLQVVPGLGAAGGLPSIAGNTVTAAGNTRGTYALNASSAALGASVSASLTVSASVANDGAHAAYASLTARLGRLQTVYTDLVDALAAGDVAGVQASAALLLGERQALDLFELRITPAFAPETGFAPLSLGGAPGPADQAFALRLVDALSQLRTSRHFLERLNAGASRNDDIRAQALNRSLDAAAEALVAASPTFAGFNNNQTGLHLLMSVEIPRLVLADLDRTLAQLSDAGLIASSTPLPATPAALYEGTRPAFFSLSGISLASTIRTQIIKNLYFKVIEKLVHHAGVLLTDGLVRTAFSAGDLDGVITGASLSFHVFDAPNSVIESSFGAEHPSQNVVYLIGPTFFETATSLLANLNPASWSNLSQVKAGVKAINTLADPAPAEQKFAFRQPAVDETIRGCLFTTDPDCGQLAFYDGFPTVYKDGLFPGPVLVVAYDASRQQFATTVVAFLPKK